MSEQGLTKTLSILALLLLAGCSRDPSIEMRSTDVSGDRVIPNTRIKVERIGIFADGLAYNDRRGVYLITDTETGREYFGVSGIGIQEVATHQQCHSNGKSTTCYDVEDER
jgi:hypothetical protein